MCVRVGFGVKLTQSCELQSRIPKWQGSFHEPTAQVSLNGAFFCFSNKMNLAFFWSREAFYLPYVR